MIIGVPQEVKNNEFRVGLTPGNARAYVSEVIQCWFNGVLVRKLV